MTHYTRNDNVCFCLDTIRNMCREIREEVDILSCPGVDEKIVYDTILRRCDELDSARRTIERLVGLEYARNIETHDVTTGITNEKGESKMEKIRINRLARRPLIFTGTLIKEVTTKTKENSFRWVDMSIYKTPSEKLVAVLHYGTDWAGESDFYDAEVFTNIDDLCRWVAENATNDLASQRHFVISVLLEDFPEEVE